MGHIIKTSIALAAMTIATVALAQSGQPVMVGGEADFDACGGVGVVHNLDPAGDNFLAVRTGPGSRFEMIDKLHTDDQVYMCDESGNWIGVVYGPNAGFDCGVSSPIARRQPYAGSCRSGWVHKRYLRLIAG